MMIFKEGDSSVEVPGEDGVTSELPPITLRVSLLSPPPQKSRWMGEQLCACLPVWTEQNFPA